MLFYAAEIFIRDLTGPLIIKAAGKETGEIIIKYVFYIFLYLIIFPLLISFNQKLSGNEEKLRSFICKPQRPVSWVIKWLTISFGMTTLSAYISNFAIIIFESLTGIEINRLMDRSDGTTADLIISFASMMFFAPVFEELFFRGTVYRNIKEKGGFIMMAIGGLIFGLWHTNTEQFIYAAVMGFFSCYMFSRTHSIIPSFLLHFILNTIGALQYSVVTEEYFDKMQSEDISYAISHPMPLIVTLIIFLIYMASSVTAMILLIIELSKVEKKPLSQSVKLSEAGKPSPASYAAAYITAPFMLAAAVLMLGMTIYNAVA